MKCELANCLKCNKCILTLKVLSKLSEVTDEFTNMGVKVTFSFYSLALRLKVEGSRESLVVVVQSVKKLHYVHANQTKLPCKNR